MPSADRSVDPTEPADILDRYGIDSPRFEPSAEVGFAAVLEDRVASGAFEFDGCIPIGVVRRYRLADGEVNGAPADEAVAGSKHGACATDGDRDNGMVRGRGDDERPEVEGS